MNKTINAGSYYHRNNYQHNENIDQQMSYHQRKTLENLILNRIDNPKEIQRRLSEMDTYNYSDAEEMLQNMKYASIR